jgi:hypothetical protein
MGEGKKTRLAVLVFTATLVLLVMTLGLAFYMRGVSQADTHEQVCKAVGSENLVLQDLISRAENQSIAALKGPHPAGETQQTVLGFYNPLLQEVEGAKC